MSTPSITPAATAKWPELAAEKNAVAIHRSMTGSLKNAAWHLILDNGDSLGPVPPAAIKTLGLPDRTTPIEHASIDLLLARNAAAKAVAALTAAPTDQLAELSRKSEAAEARRLAAKAGYLALKADAA